MVDVRYRSHGNRPAPRMVRITVPGWAGDKQPRADGSHEQPWHCLPFSESARYAVEVIYPFAPELRVTTVDGRVQLDADWGPAPDDEPAWPPFRPFGNDYYSYQLSLDLAVPPGYAVRTEPHPRYFTDLTHQTPLAVPALIRSDWWPMVFFAIFRAPPPGVTHVFRHGEAMMSFIILPEDPAIDLAPMSEDEAAQRELRARRMSISRDQLAQGTRWTSDTHTVFDGTYRNLYRAARARQPNLPSDDDDPAMNGA